MFTVGHAGRLTSSACFRGNCDLTYGKFLTIQGIHWPRTPAAHEHARTDSIDPFLQNFIRIRGWGGIRVPRWTDFPVVGKGNTGGVADGFPRPN